MESNETELLDTLFVEMDEDPDTPMLTFNDVDWLNGVKIQKCMDEPTLLWIKEVEVKLQGL